MDNFALYGKLIQIPLFQGMSKDELGKIVSKTKFGFSQVQPGSVIAREGDKCGKLLLLVNGIVSMETISDDGSYKVQEQVASPTILQPERSFGLTQLFTHTFVAQTVCNLISIDKDETMKLTEKSMIFRINLINIISTALQKAQRMTWKSLPQGREERIGRFFISHCLHPAGTKVFHIKMERLAKELNDTRLNISRTLNDMQRAGLLKLSRAKITIPSLERLPK